AADLVAAVAIAVCAGAVRMGVAQPHVRAASAVQKMRENAMKKFAVALALGMMAAGAAFAQPMMQNAFGNTIVVTEPSGAVVRYHFNADNTFDLVAPNGQTVAGTYRVDGGQICLTPSGGQEACTEYVGDKNVGDTWQQRATDGNTITITLQAGR